mmetsp:Transcript_25027/g.78861  ORF Transcript_25027/g.78861 Transcript_25027/m.78861 type:complete len:509 (-) Transcript_25027:435-1961(-)
MRPLAGASNGRRRHRAARKADGRVLLELAHQGLEPPAHGAGLLQHRHDVHAPRHALEAHAADDELVEADLLVGPHVEDIKERARVEGVQLLRGKVCLHPVVLQVAPELGPTDGARVVRVRLLEDAPHLDEEVLVALQLRLDHQVLVEAAQLLGPFHEDTCEHVEHADDHEDDVEGKEQGVDRGDLVQRPRRRKPVLAAGDPGQEREHGVHHGAVPGQHSFAERVAGLVVSPEAHDRALHEDDREEVHDDDEQQQGPRQRPEGLQDHADHEPQVAEEAQQAHDAQHAEHAQAPDDAQGAQSDVLDEHLHEGYQHQDHVEHVPPPVRAGEEALPQEGEAAGDLEAVEGREGAVRRGEPRGVLPRRVLQRLGHALVGGVPQEGRVHQDHRRAGALEPAALHAAAQGRGAGALPGGAPGPLLVLQLLGHGPLQVVPPLLAVDLLLEGVLRQAPLQAAGGGLVEALARARAARVEARVQLEGVHGRLPRQRLVGTVGAAGQRGLPRAGHGRPA